MQCPHYKPIDVFVPITMLSYSSGLTRGYNTKSEEPDILSQIGLPPENPNKERTIRKETNAVLVKIALIPYGECKKKGELALCQGVSCTTDYEARKQFGSYLPMLLRLFRNAQQRSQTSSYLLRSNTIVDEKPPKIHIATGEAPFSFNIFEKPPKKSKSTDSQNDVKSFFSALFEGIPALTPEDPYIRINLIGKGKMDKRRKTENPDDEIPESVKDLIRLLDRKRRGNSTES